MVKRAAWAIGLLLTAALPLAGCGQFGGAALYMAGVPDRPSKTVPAEYAHLAGHKVAVIVWTHESTEQFDPQLAPDLARYVESYLKRGLEGMSFVPQHTIQRYKFTNLRWTDTSEVELGRKFDAEMVLYITVDYYTLTRPGQMIYQQGRLSASCSLFDLSQPRGHEKVWTKTDMVVEYPPEEYGLGISTDSGKTRKQLLEIFGERLANCFRDHKEPVDE